MRLATVRDVGGLSHAAIDLAGIWHALPFRDVGELLGDPRWRERVDSGEAFEPLTDPVLTTLVPAPRKVICCGHNYRDHIAEMGHSFPAFPTLFTKFADTLCGPYDDIVLDDRSAEADWEAELAVVVGREVSRVDSDEARDAIAGYTVANDISLRDWQGRTSQWLQGKAFDATTPVGPVLVTADEIDPAHGLRITCTIGSDIVQDANTATLVFDAPELVSYISQFTVLRPGDVILTGTPGGVGAAMRPPRFLSDGDVVTTSIDRIGTIVNRIRVIGSRREGQKQS